MRFGLHSSANVKKLSLTRERGFTLVELVTVIVLLGIVSIYVALRFFDAELFRSHGSYNELVSAIRYAQKLAVASGCPVEVDLQGGGYTLRQPANADCTGGFVSLPDGHPVSANTLSGIAGPPAFTFNARGQVTGGNVTVSLGGETIQITGATGYVDMP